MALKLCYLAGPARLDEADAVGRHALGMVNALAARGHAVTLFAPPGVLEIEPNVEFIPVRAPRTRLGWLNALVFYALLPLRCWRHFRRLRPGSVYSRMSYLDFLAIAPLKARYRFRYLAEVNGIASLESRRGPLTRRLIGALESLSLRSSDHVVAVTPELRAWAMKIRDAREAEVTVVGNGVDSRLFRPMPRAEACRRLALDPDLRYLCFVGSLKPWHDMQTALEALVRLAARLRGVRLLVVGDGPQRERLEQSSARLGMGPYVVWQGTVAPDRVPLYVNAAEVCLAPLSAKLRAVTGAAPLKVLEYMACARAFVMTRVGGESAAEIARWDCGVLVPPQDPDALAEAVLGLLDDEDRARRLGERGRMLVEQRFDWRLIAARVERLVSGDRG